MLIETFQNNGQKCFMYEGAKLWNSISNGIKTIENISEFKTLLKKWNGSPCICKNCIICTISYMYIDGHESKPAISILAIVQESRKTSAFRYFSSYSFYFIT